MIKKVIYYSGIVWLLIAAQIVAAEIKIISKNPQQGSMVVGQYIKSSVDENIQDVDIYFNQTKLLLSEQGLFVFGVGRDSPAKVTLSFQIANQPKQEFVLPIKSRHWKIERIDGLPPSKISPKSKHVLKRISKEAKLVRTARNSRSQQTSYAEVFIKPAAGRISGVYGSQRVLNGEPKRPHYGLDIANKTGTAVFAPIAGVVTLVHPDMFYSGGTLVIDHGFGISSTYIHLSEINVEVGQKLKQGQQIAKIGATGRATGPHLDWRLNWFQTRLDPELLIN